MEDEFPGDELVACCAGPSGKLAGMRRLTTRTDILCPWVISQTRTRQQVEDRCGVGLAGKRT
jgi:hypothetical protein